MTPYAQPTTYRAPTEEEAGAANVCAQCGGPVAPGELVVVETVERVVFANAEEVAALNADLAAAGLPDVDTFAARIVHVCGICPTCAEPLTRPAKRIH